MAMRCLVLGSALCLRSDLTRALELAEFEGVVACKGAGLEWRGRLDAWVSLHPERLESDMAKRREAGHVPADRTYGHRPAPGVSHHMAYKWPDQKLSGSSGLFAVRVAIEELGFDRLVLCGMPLERSQGRLDGRVTWNGARSFKEGWRQALPHIRDKVRSMSGWTREILGEPTPEWLGVDDPC